MSENGIVDGGLTQKEIKKLKEEYGKIVCIEVEIPDQDDQYYWFKKPTVETLSAVAKVSLEEPAKGTEVLFNACLIKGNQNIITEDIDVWANLSRDLEQLIEDYNTRVKKY